MKTRVLFIIPNFEHGGTNKALENLLSLLDSNRFESFIACTLPKSKGYYSTIFQDKTISFPKWFQLFLSNRILNRLQYFLLRYFHFFLWQPIYWLVMRQIKSLYSIDTVVAFQETMPTYVGAGFSGNSIAWVHCDYHEYSKNRRYKEESVYKKYDGIICVSSQSKSGFIKCYPQFENKTFAIHNTLDVTSILKQSNADIQNNEFSNDCFTILSIGRFCAEKQFELIPIIVKQILDKAPNLKFKWFIIGGGSSNHTAITKERIQEYNIDSYIHLLGMQDNPYCYLAHSDLLVSTSSTESCPYVVNEAKVLHIPVVSNNYPSAYELITDENGVIVNIAEMPDVLIELISNSHQAYTSLKNRCNNTCYSNESILNQIEKLISKN